MSDTACLRIWKAGGMRGRPSFIDPGLPGISIKLDIGQSNDTNGMLAKKWSNLPGYVNWNTHCHLHTYILIFAFKKNDILIITSN